MVVSGNEAEDIDANVKLDLTDPLGKPSQVLHAFISNNEWKNKVKHLFNPFFLNSGSHAHKYTLPDRSMVQNKRFTRVISNSMAFKSSATFVAEDILNKCSIFSGFTSTNFPSNFFTEK